MVTTIVDGGTVHMPSFYRHFDKNEKLNRTCQQRDRKKLYRRVRRIQLIEFV
jgi:adenylylsulfate kinase-like enzyme